MRSSDGAVVLTLVLAIGLGGGQATTPSMVIDRYEASFSDSPIMGRNVTLSVDWTYAYPGTYSARLIVPAWIEVAEPVTSNATIEAEGASATYSWTVRATRPGFWEIRVERQPGYPQPVAAVFSGATTGHLGARDHASTVELAVCGRTVGDDAVTIDLTLVDLPEWAGHARLDLAVLPPSGSWENASERGHAPQVAAVVELRPNESAAIRVDMLASYVPESRGPGDGTRTGLETSQSIFVARRGDDLAFLGSEPRRTKFLSESETLPVRACWENRGAEEGGRPVPSGILLVFAAGTAAFIVMRSSRR